MNWRPLLAAFSLARLAMAASPTCSSLINLFIPNTTITAADDVPAGMYNPSGTPASVNLPAFCRIRAISRPVNDSEIHFELWMPPHAAWNGKFEGTGNGGFSSAMSFGTMAAALNHGYATAGSDTGHEGGDLPFGDGHPEKINDWAYRSVHMMTDTAKIDYSRLLQPLSAVLVISMAARRADSKRCLRRSGFQPITMASSPAILATTGYIWSRDFYGPGRRSTKILPVRCRPPNCR